MGRSKLSQIFASVLVNAVYAMQNYPVTFISTLLSPLSILIVITFVSHGTLIGVGVVGALIMAMVSSGTGLQGDLSHLKNDFKLQDMVVSSPTREATYVFGMAISEIIYSLPAIIVLTILAAIYVHPGALQALAIILVMCVMFAFSTVLGFLLSTFTSDVIQSWAFSGIVSLILTTIPPVYYPISYIPLPYQYLAYLSPTTYGAEIAQSAMGYIHISQLNLVADWAVLAAVIAVLFLIAYKKARWREE